MAIINIEAASWRSIRPIDLEVIKFIHKCMTQLFSGELPYNILLRYSSECPQTFYRNDIPPNQPTTIQLTTKSLSLWCQVAYQLSHELCHVLTNYEEQKIHRANQWLTEALCETASICVLEVMDACWREDGASLPLREYARQESIRKYIEEVTHKYKTEDLSAYFEQWRESMQRDPYVKDKQARACNRLAGKMIPHFIKEQSLWKECRLINKWDLSNSEPIEGYLRKWYQSLQKNQQQARLPKLIYALLGLNPVIHWEVQ